MTIVLRGYATTWRTTHADSSGQLMRVEPGAIRSFTNVRLIADHDEYFPPLARTNDNTLRMWNDARGLAIEADLPATREAGRIVESWRAGRVVGLSIGSKAGSLAEVDSDGAWVFRQLELDEVSICSR